MKKKMNGPRSRNYKEPVGEVCKDGGIMGALMNTNGGDTICGRCAFKSFKTKKQKISQQAFPSSSSTDVFKFKTVFFTHF